MGLVQPLRSATVMATSTATDTAINLEKGVDMVLDPNIASDKGSDTLPVQPQASAIAMAPVTAMDSEQTVSLAVASQSNDADTAPIQPSASAIGMASVTAMNLEQTVDSDDNDSRFSQGLSSEEFEFTGDDDVTKDGKKQILSLTILSFTTTSP